MCILKITSSKNKHIINVCCTYLSMCWPMNTYQYIFSIGFFFSGERRGVTQMNIEASVSIVCTNQNKIIGMALTWNHWRRPNLTRMDAYKSLHVHPFVLIVTANANAYTHTYIHTCKRLTDSKQTRYSPKKGTLRRSTV